jgi:FkbM family methyltransferase
MLTTKTKVTLASLAYRCVAAARAAAGKNDSVIVNRGGLRWSLNLAEGIDFSIYLLGAFEPSTASTIQKLVKPGDVAFDIGANIGAHTLGIARAVGPEGRVFAFEPTDFAFEKLQLNLGLNPDLAARTIASQILLVASASNNHSQPPEIYASWPLENTGAVHPKHRGRLATTRNAHVDTLDDFAVRHSIDRVDFIKIDVDGHELPVLRGGLHLLTSLHPVLLVEMSPYVHAEEQNSFADLVALLRDAGYAIQDAATWQPLPLDAAKLEQLIPDGASINVIARPKT